MWGMRLWGRNNAADVTKAGALKVAIIENDVPDSGTQNKYQYLKGRLGSMGLNNGILNLNVDGSVTPQVFYIQSANDYDIYVTRIGIVIGGGNISHGNFGSLAALTNGVDLILNEGGTETIIVDKAKTAGEVIIQSGFTGAFGNTTTTWELTDYVGNNDAYVISIPMGEYVPGGLRIGRGTIDNLRMVVNDNLTTLAEFRVIIFGYKHIVQ